MNIKRLAASGVMLAMLLTGAVMAHGETADFGNPADFKTGMEENFYVQEGSFRELDTIEMASQGKLMSCFGNNAGSVYTVFFLPPAPEQDYAIGNPQRGWADEAPTAIDDPEIENYPANPFFSPAGWQYKLRQDEALPSIRSLAKDLRISVITTKRAYDELEAEGFIYTLPGKGSFVAPKNTELLREENLRRIEEHMREISALAVQSGLTRQELSEMYTLISEEELT